MKGDFLSPSFGPMPGGGFSAGLFANKAALVLDWLLTVGIDREAFSIREVARDRRVSVGLVQKVFSELVHVGVLSMQGVRTRKRFSMKDPARLLDAWEASYDFVSKCRVWTYRTGLKDRKALVTKWKSSDLSKQSVLALHSAAESHGYRYTNLETLELYLLPGADRSQFEGALALAPQERGYDVLLIEPHYKAWLDPSMDATPLLLTYLDLAHYPLRGKEQAEVIAERSPIFKRMRSKSDG